MAEIFLCATGQLTNAARRDLRRAGVIVVEVEDPSTCQFIRATETISADDMVWAAVDALRRNFGGYDGGKTGSDTDHKHREQFTVNLFTLIDAARAKRRKDDDHA